MRGIIFLLFYGIVIAYGYPFYDDYEGYDPKEYFETIDTEDLVRSPRNLDNIFKKTSSRAINLARDFIRTLRPSASQFGYNGIQRMVRNVDSINQNSSPPAATIASSVPLTNGYGYYNYQYPGMGLASYYGYPGYQYASYQTPYYGYNSVYQGQFDASKRNYMPYSYLNTYYPQTQPQALPQGAYQFKYPASIATSTAVKQSISNPEPAKAHVLNSEKHEGGVADTSTASGISQGLIDLENDVNGFNQAIQYMKEAFVAENNDGSSELQERIHEDKSDVVGDKKDLIKKKKTSSELMEAFKRTLDSKEKLENKLVNYFTNYVCGDDC